MEVGTADSDKPTEINRTVEWLTTTMQHLATKIAKLEARNDRTTSKKTIRCYPGPAAPRLSTTRHPRDFNEQCQHHDRQHPSADRRLHDARRQHSTAHRINFNFSFWAGPQPRRQLLCYACGRPGQLAADCPTRIGSLQGNAPAVLALNGRTGNHLCPTINLVISGILVTTLVDTGATCSLLRRDVFNLVVNRTHHSNVRHKSLPLRILGGIFLQVGGQTQIKVAGVKTPLNVVICRNIPQEMILGNDTLQSGNGVIDLQSNILSWNHNTWPLKQTSPGYASVGPIFPETGSTAIDELVQNNADVFAANGEKNGCCNTGQFRIKTSNPPICQKAYRMPLTKHATVDKLISEMLADDIIHPSNLAYASPILFVPKKHGEK